MNKQPSLVKDENSMNLKNVNRWERVKCMYSYRKRQINSSNLVFKYEEKEQRKKIFGSIKNNLEF